jgi:hypothetical protein
VSEASRVLQELLESRPGAEKCCDVGTHSCKATLLSMMSKWGGSSDDHHILGDHIKDKSFHHYSRDSLAGPLRRLSDMLADVRSGRFLPDCSRSGRFVKEGTEGVPGDPKVKGPSEGPKKRPPESSSSSSDGSGASSVCPEPVDLVDELESWSAGGRPVQNLPLGPTYCHGITAMIHVGRNDLEDRLACNRVISKHFVALPPETAVSQSWPQCRQCFKL